MLHVNEVLLVGRVSGEPERTALTDGTEVIVWRVIIDGQAERTPRQTTDTIRCAAYAPGLRDTAGTLRHDDTVEVRGALRHRFWQGPDGPRGLYEIEVTDTIRLRPAMPSGRA